VTLAEVLRAARAKIATPETWTKRAFARDIASVRVFARSTSAVCWCAIGAIDSLDITADDACAAGEAGEALVAANRGRAVSYFNDDPRTTHANILALYDRAIALAEAT
jgi:hypothetical protein